MKTDNPTPRNSNKKLREGGALILINNNRKHKSKKLPLIKTNNDNITKIVRARICAESEKKPFKIDVLNMHIPSMCKGDKNDKRAQNVNTSSSFNLVLEEHVQKFK